MLDYGLKWPDKKYPVIVADPPWNFKTFSNKGEGRSAEQHYPCMNRKEVMELPVASLAQDAAVLFLWTTPQDMDFAINTVIPSWGFIYKTTGFTWLKTKKSLEETFLPAFNQWKQGETPDFIDVINYSFVVTKGYYTRKQSEICLIGTTKKTLSRSNKGVREIIVAPRREHSRKPDEIYNRIEALYSPEDGFDYIELFARATGRPYWDSWGLETEKFSIE